MKIQLGTSQFSKRYTIAPLSSEPNRDFITVYITKVSPINDKEKIEINWSSIGSVDAVTAKEFAAGLAKAVAIAENEHNKIGCECPSCGRHYPEQAICDSDECPAYVKA